MKTPTTLVLCITCLIDLSAATPAFPSGQNKPKVYFSHCMCLTPPVSYAEAAGDGTKLLAESIFDAEEATSVQADQDWRFILLHGDEFPVR